MATKIEAVSILHIDPNQLFREGLRQILGDSHFTVDGEASTIEEGLSQLPDMKPGMILFDAGCYSEEALKALMVTAETTSPHPRVVILTDTVAISRLANALNAGIGGYLLKDMSTDALKQSLKLVLMGETVFPTDLAYLLINNRFVVSSSGGVTNGIGGLSPRDTEILSCLVNGLSNKEIAIRLDITEGTVKVHLKGILKKIHVHNRTQAAIWAVQNGIIADVAKETTEVRVKSRLCGIPLSGLKPLEPDILG